MQSKKSSFKDSIVIAISTFFYIGYLPFIPGTFGSIAGVFLFYLVNKDMPVVYRPFFLSAFAFFLIVLGFLFSGRAERILNKKDARCIVIDEVAGMFLSLLFMPYNIKLALLAFLLFRILDALKPYPAGPFQRLRGSLGIMSDDIVAGLYTNIILQAVLRLVSFKTS